VMWTAERDTNETTSTTTPSTFEDPDGSEERYHDLAAAVMPDEAAQAQEQRCGEEDVRSRDEQPDPPERVLQQIPVRMPADERQRDENSCGREREGCCVVTCLSAKTLDRSDGIEVSTRRRWAKRLASQSWLRFRPLHGLIVSAFRQFTQTEYPEAHQQIWAAEPEAMQTAVYPDLEFERILAKATVATRSERRSVLRRFGIFASLSTFRLLHPGHYEQNTDVRGFLLGVEKRIHQLVRDSLPGSAPPRLRATTLGEHGVALSYTSERHLCEMLEGLVVGVSRYYGQPVEIEEPLCMLRGDETGCSFFITPTEA
jgi:hypothetical protein